MDPPLLVKLAGRPKLKRIRDKNEAVKSGKENGLLLGKSGLCHVQPVENLATMLGVVIVSSHFIY